MRQIALAAAALLAVLVLAVPAMAATPPTVRGNVGPGFVIGIAKKPTKPGKVRLVVSDKSSIHNFRLRGPGVNVATGVAATGTRTFTITLKKGLYRFVCDPHASSMNGSFRIR